MSISRSDIELICNYKETDQPSKPKGTMYYMDVLTSTDEWVINQRKRINRQKTIDEVLGEKSDDSEMDWLPFGGSVDNVMSPRMMSMTVGSRFFTDMDSLYNDIILYLEGITSSPMKTSTSPMNVQNMGTGFDNHGTTKRRIITKLTFCNNTLMMSSRMGPSPTTAIVGSDIIEYLDDYIMNGNHINGTNIVYSPLIKSNKVIVVKTQKDIGAGLNVIKHDDGKYYIKETPTYEKMIAWFELI